MQICRDGPGTAVVIGDAGDGFTYQAMNQAFRALIAGAGFVALAANRTFKDADGELSIDCGAFVSALEFATGAKAVVLGKPSPDFFRAAAGSMGLELEDTVMVGDDAEADVAGALTAGCGAALLVRSGKYVDGDETRFTPPPSSVVDSLAQAADWIVARAG